VICFILLLGGKYPINEHLPYSNWLLVIYADGETISTAFVESTVNEVISRRMVKKQQMRWTKRGAHLLLQVRVQTLNGDLKALFRRWYPEMVAAGTEREALPLAV
jgi:hypothetical protein